MLKFRIYDKEKDEYLPDLVTAIELAKSRKFPDNAEDFYEFKPVCGECGVRVSDEVILCYDCDSVDMN